MASSTLSSPSAAAIIRANMSPSACPRRRVRRVSDNDSRFFSEKGLMMTRTVKRIALAAASVAGVLGAMTFAPRMTAQLSGQAPGFPSTKNGEWPYYTADVKGSRYSPLDQINGTNFNQLEVAWR